MTVNNKIYNNKKRCLDLPKPASGCKEKKQTENTTPIDSAHKNEDHEVRIQKDRRHNRLRGTRKLLGHVTTQYRRE
jgi:hypothetical protein